MHARPVAWTLWREWARVEHERAAVAADLERRRQRVPAVRVRWGRLTFDSAEAIRSVPPPAWARLDPAGMERYRSTVAGLVDALACAERRAEEARRSLGVEALEARARRLEEEARRLARAAGRAPLTRTRDVLARLDLIAAMWGEDGTLAEPAAPLAELLALMDELTRHAPDFVPTWRARQRAAGP